jgi:hypothetical protein
MLVLKALLRFSHNQGRTHDMKAKAMLIRIPGRYRALLSLPLGPVDDTSTSLLPHSVIHLKFL